MHAAPDPTLGRYRILGELGRGGMGVVHHAEDSVLGRPVALKLLSAHLSHDEEFRARFGREAALLARLDSPHVVQIYDFGQQDETLYMVTQYVEGGDLAALLRDGGPLAPAIAVQVMLQLCDGLASAHELGVIHRDVKPSNVLVRRRGDRLSAYLCDFGIAATAESEHTRAGIVVGSPAYMAPERHDGARPDVRGDVYSLGCVLWALLTGAPPFGVTPAQMLRSHLTAPPPQLEDNSPLAATLNAILDRALAKDAGRRHSDVRSIASALAALDTTRVPAPLIPSAGAIPAPEAGVASAWAGDVTLFGERTTLVSPSATPTVAVTSTVPTATTFSVEDVERIETAIEVAGARARTSFSVYIGRTDPPPERYARRLHNSLNDPRRSVLLMIDPEARVFHIVTGSELLSQLPDPFVADVAASMQGQFARGQMGDGLVDGVGLLAGRIQAT